MGIFDFFKKKTEASVPETTENFVSVNAEAILKAAHKELKEKDIYYWHLKSSDLEVFKDKVLSLQPKEKVAFISEAVDYMNDYNNNNRGVHDDKGYVSASIALHFIKFLLRSKFTVDEEDIHTIASAFKRGKWNGQYFFHFPIAHLLSHIETYIEQNGNSDSLSRLLNSMLAMMKEKPHPTKEDITLTARVERIIFNADNLKTGAVKPFIFVADDPFAVYANQMIGELPPLEKEHWWRILDHASTATSATPSKKFLQQAEKLVEDKDAFRSIVINWIKFLWALKDRALKPQYDYQNDSLQFIAHPTIDLMKGIVWTALTAVDTALLFNIARLAERSFRKIPGQGPAAAVLGNACLYVLANAGIEGVGHLSRLRLRVKHLSTQNMIDKYLRQAAERSGMSIEEMEDMAVDDHGLEDGKKEFAFEEYKAVIQIEKASRINISWFKPDGSPQKSEPAFAKQNHKQELKELKDLTKQVEATTAAQRDRIERNFRYKREWNWQQFNEYFLSHGLMSFFAKRLVWTFTQDGNQQSAILLNDEWQHPGGKLSFNPGNETKVSLWHPVFSSVEEIKNWREFFMQQEIVQPVKQVFREVYLITDAEINTSTYSNRFAAHILKQHQFAQLAKGRGWRYALRGGFDHGGMPASLDIPKYNIRAEYWIEDLHADDNFSDSGMYMYISTDQVCFFRQSDGERMQLAEVPALLFSEVMRDVDLFVGVASVGNDPAWRDNGGTAALNHRNYWSDYSFGDLNEQAKTRKQVMEKLLPRLKIAKVAEIKDKWLVVKGKIRTYKIHLGSTNILMEPNDQYLCIVTDRSQKTEAVFLPFEGDTGISLIISKALLLAEDDKIKDTTILRQINS
jgi:hypothetical protein